MKYKHIAIVSRHILGTLLLAAAVTSSVAQDAKTESKSANDKQQPSANAKPGYDAAGHKLINETIYKDISVAEAEKFLADHPDAVILDVRTPKEFAAGHLPNAKNYNVKEDNYKEVLAPLDKSKHYVVHSAVGHWRTVRTLEYFQANGFEHAVAIEGGYKAWSDAGKPTVK